MNTSCSGLHRFHYILLAVLGAALAAGCVSPPYPNELVLQHIPTVLGLALLVWYQSRHGLSRTAFALAIAFLLFHILGARWIYSYVPYDDWSASVFGVRISDVFGFRRNHYDRLIHFLYGLFFARIAYEIAVRRFALRPAIAAYIALEFVMATSMLYELIEWLIAVVLSPDAAEAYNGQQGDMWDAQKDMALASLGAVITTAVGLLRMRSSRSRQDR